MVSEVLLGLAVCVCCRGTPRAALHHAEVQQEGGRVGQMHGCTPAVPSMACPARCSAQAAGCRSAAAGAGTHGLNHLLVQVIALARALPHASKHGVATCRCAAAAQPSAGVAWPASCSCCMSSYRRSSSSSSSTPSLREAGLHPHWLMAPAGMGTGLAEWLGTNARRAGQNAPWALATLLMSSMMSTVLPTPAPPKRPILPPRA